MNLIPLLPNARADNRFVNAAKGEGFWVITPKSVKNENELMCKDLNPISESRLSPCSITVLLAPPKATVELNHLNPTSKWWVHGDLNPEPRA